jgi:saccharopine dehydrogenase-like NADP-dependent oxidoreductase
MANTVFVLGAGRMGLVAARDVAESDLVDNVILGDIETSGAERLCKELGPDKIKAVRVDGTDRSNLARAIRDSQVLINAIWYEHNLRVMKTAIEMKVHYNDLGGLFHVTRQQMELNDAAQRAGVTAVLGGGASPGITNVMCAASAEEFESVEDMRIRVGAKQESHAESDKLVFPFAIPTILDEYSKRPVMYLDGRFQDVEPLSGEEEVEFAQPIGKNVCHYSIHSETATLPLSFKGVRHVDFKLGVSEKLFRAIKPLVEAGMCDNAPIDVKGQKISPRDFAIAYLASRASDVEPLRYIGLRSEVTGVKSGRKICQIREVVGEPSEKLGVRNATGLLTGIGASIIAQFILAGKIVKNGVVAPEICVPTEPFMRELERRKIRVTMKELKVGS